MPTRPPDPVPEPVDDDERERREHAQGAIALFLETLQSLTYRTRSHMPAGLDATNFMNACRDVREFCAARPDWALEALATALGTDAKIEAGATAQIAAYQRRDQESRNALQACNQRCADEDAREDARVERIIDWGEMLLLDVQHDLGHERWRVEQAETELLEAQEKIASFEAAFAGARLPNAKAYEACLDAADRSLKLAADDVRRLEQEAETWKYHAKKIDEDLQRERARADDHSARLAEAHIERNRWREATHAAQRSLAAAEDGLSAALAERDAARKAGDAAVFVAARAERRLQARSRVDARTAALRGENRDLRDLFVRGMAEALNVSLSTLQRPDNAWFEVLRSRARELWARADWDALRLARIGNRVQDVKDGDADPRRLADEIAAVLASRPGDDEVPF